MSYREALKKWNEGKGTWCMPKRGTKEHDEVKKIQIDMAINKKIERIPSNTDTDKRHKAIVQEFETTDAQLIRKSNPFGTDERIINHLAFDMGELQDDYGEGRINKFNLKEADKRFNSLERQFNYYTNQLKSSKFYGGGEQYLRRIRGYTSYLSAREDVMDYRKQLLKYINIFKR